MLTHIRFSDPDCTTGPTLTNLVLCTAEDLEDRRLADEGMESLKKDGPISLDDVRQKLGLE